MQRRLLTEPRRPEAIRNHPQAHWLVVAAVCAGAFMGQLDASIVTVALPHIGQSLHAGAAIAQWVALSYMFVLLGTLVLAGQLADVVGRKLLYTYGFGVFTGCSLLCGLAPSLPLLIGARVLQGLGAAMLQANSVALIREAMPSRLLARGIGVQGAAQAIGLALGPAVGGLLVALGGWRLIFFLNLPIGLIAIGLARLLIPRSRLRKGRRLALREFGEMLRKPAVALGLTAGLISYLTMFGALLTIPYYLLATGAGPAASGLQLAMLPVTLALAAPLTGRLAERTGEQSPMSGGLLLCAGGLALVALMPSLPTRLVGLALAGAGLGAFTPLNNAAVMAAGPRERAGLLGGLVNMTRTLGAMLGVALASLLYGGTIGRSSVARGMSSGLAAHGLLVSLLVLATLSALASIVPLAQSALARSAATGNAAH